MNLIITQRHTADARKAPIDSLENSYASFFYSAGCQLFPIPNLCGNVSDFVQRISPDGIVLSGGGDVSPGLYGGARRDGDQVSPDRDRIEYGLLDYAVKERIPLLGICRGMQLINVYFGGSLVADIALRGDSGLPVIGNHPVELEDGELVARLGSSEISVNSYHTQGIPLDGVGRSLTVFASYPALSIAEGIRHRELPIAGIQWHPERNGAVSSLDQILVDAFINGKLYWEKSH